MAFKSIFHREFKYRNADCTDVRLTFERIRREQRRAQRAAQAEAATSRSTPALARADDEPPAT
jgi:hypothetical protein